MSLTIRKKALLPASRISPASDVSRNDLFRGETPSFWNFWKHGVTSSFISTFLACRAQACLTYVKGLASREIPLSLEFGTCVHWILEQIYSRPNLPLVAYCQVPEQHKGAYLRNLVESYHRSVWLPSVPSPSRKQHEQQELAYGLAEAVLPAYFRRWEGDFTGKYPHANQAPAPHRWLSLEEVFCIPYTFPDGRQTYIRGRRDGVFEDKAGKVWVFDTKCLSVISDGDILDTFPVNPQQMLYVHATEAERRHPTSLHLPQKEGPSGCVLNVIRRPQHRQKMDEPLPQFLARVAEDVALPEKYDHNFIRYKMVLAKGDLESWRTQFLDPVMGEIRGWWEGRIPHYMNPNGLITKYGRCQLFDALVKGDFSGCYRRSKVFNELPEVL